MHINNPETRQKFSSLYFFPALTFILLTLFLPVKTFLYFSIVSGFLLAYETILLFRSHLHILLFIIISPIFNYFITVFTFPIRLHLSQVAVSILSSVNSVVKQKGNIIEINNEDFSVDAECMGLNMVSVGLLIGVFLLAYYQKRTGRKVNFLYSLIMLGCIFLLIILANLFRIVFIVQLNIPQQTFLHELTGDLCFLAYVIIPAALYIQWKIKQTRISITKRTLNYVVLSRPVIVRNSILSVCLIVLTVYVLKQKELSKANTYLVDSPVTGFKSKVIGGDILKLEKPDALIYVKHIRSFYSTEHSPMICWKGSGYNLEKIKEEEMEGRHVYTAELTKGKDTLYTCWWFDNGDYQTVDQLKWRWKVLRGAKEFSIVNVTAATNEQLLKNVSEIFSGDIVNKTYLKQNQD
jgi:exosortase N